MSDIQYKIEFFSYWHCSSGQSAGADVDEIVVKDSCGLPFVPGKTIKGLFRDACSELEKYGHADGNFLKRVFGTEDSMSECFFSNAVLGKSERDYISQEELSDYMYDSVSATAIGEDGIAADHSLRRMQVVLPCTLYGTIVGVPQDCAETLTKSMGLIKRLGGGRSRGFGRCMVSKEGK